MAQAFLAGGARESRAPAQVTVTLCPACRKGTTDAGGEPVVLTPSELEDVVKMAFQATLSLPTMRRVSRVRS
jgi:hypothetical protein